MGVGVSNWTLANAVARCGHLGVVSGTVIDTLFVRRLAGGDAGGHLRRAMARFPIPGVAELALQRYWREGGVAADEAFPLLPMWKRKVEKWREQVAMLASFVEVTLAKEGHTGPVGMNLLTKVQMPNLATLYGAMLAGVDVVLMGAGIPREIPGVLDGLSQHQAVEMKLDVEGLSAGRTEVLRLEPGDHWVGTAPPEIGRPLFLPIISANSLAATLARKATGRVDGFVVEGPTAGGHNAPPRGEMRLNASGEPIYGERDVVDLGKMRELGLPFWLAGGTGSPGALEAARAEGAHGVQVGTLFAFCQESGIDAELKQRVLHSLWAGEVEVRTDALASPTGYPFKVVKMQNDPDDARRAARPRECDLGYLRVAYERPDGRLGYRCAAEPVEDFVAKGGTACGAEGRLCLCNGLLANLGLGQRREEGMVEPPLLTSGSDMRDLRTLMGRYGTSYSAANVVQWIVGAAVPAGGVA
jgi:NAD(P)H-dependent flavin oxidoreductase YrpB (nitropropane dioxygenase family)